jgi:CDGSH-type Zn-finger protein
VNVMNIVPDGPYECRGEIEIRDAAGNLLAARSEAWFCRCGQSKNKPYCDSSHKQAGFVSHRFAMLTGELPRETVGPVRVRLRQDGPLRVEGPCEVRSPDGTTLYFGSETALCRCGQSGKKPFCDGTHRQIGFVAP